MLNRLKVILQSWSEIICGALLVLITSGCNSYNQNKVSTDDDLTSKALSDTVSFTTQGKPTKTIETPWGPYEVYDPAQDEEVLAAIEEIYNQGDTTFGDLERNGRYGYKNEFRVEPQGTAKLIRRVRRVQYYDLMRLGCSIPQAVPCEPRGITFLQAKCEDSIFGSYKLSKCEKENLRYNITDIGGPVLAPLKNPKMRWEGWLGGWPSNVCTIAGIESSIQIPTYIGDVSDYNIEETQKLLTTTECLKWSDNFEREQEHEKALK